MRVPSLVLTSACAFSAGCFNPPEVASDDVGDTDTESPGDTTSITGMTSTDTTTSDPQTTADPSSDDGDDGDDESDDASTGSEDDAGLTGGGATTGGVVGPLCGDGISVAHELCFDAGVLEQYLTGTGPVDLAIGDIDGDGALDLLTVGFDASELSVLQSNGVGGFSSPDTYDAGVRPHRVRLGDFDGDGDSDVVVAGESIMTFWNQSGTLVSMANPGGFGSSFGVHSMEVLDGNNDGVLDVIYSSAYDYTFAEGTIMNSRWALNPLASIIGAGEGAAGLWATKFVWDGDDLYDVVGVNQYYSHVTITLGNGDGSFVEVSEHQVCPGEFAGTRHVITDDVNGDGTQDIIVTCMAGDFSVSLGVGDGNWQPFVAYPLEGAFRPYVADLDRDGDLDLLVPSETLNRIVVYINDGSGQYELSDLELYTDGPPFTVEVTDLDDDGAVDILTAAADHVVVWFAQP